MGALWSMGGTLIFALLISVVIFFAVDSCAKVRLDDYAKCCVMRDVKNVIVANLAVKVENGLTCFDGFDLLSCWYGPTSGGYHFTHPRLHNHITPYTGWSRIGEGHLCIARNGLAGHINLYVQRRTFTSIFEEHLKLGFLTSRYFKILDSEHSDPSSLFRMKIINSGVKGLLGIGCLAQSSSGSNFGSVGSGLLSGGLSLHLNECIFSRFFAGNNGATGKSSRIIRRSSALLGRISSDPSGLTLVSTNKIGDYAGCHKEGRKNDKASIEGNLSLLVLVIMLPAVLFFAFRYLSRAFDNDGFAFTWNFFLGAVLLLVAHFIEFLCGVIIGE